MNSIPWILGTGEVLDQLLEEPLDIATSLEKKRTKRRWYSKSLRKLRKNLKKLKLRLKNQRKLTIFSQENQGMNL